MVCLAVGAVDIPLAAVFDILVGNTEGYEDSWIFIIMESRLPATVTAFVSGMSLAVSGLLLQTVFQNPLAGPSVFGVNSGASLAVSILMLTAGGSLSAFSSTLGGQMAVVVAAVIGASAVMFIIIGISAIVRSNVMLLIIGMMIGYLASSAISILSYFASEDGLQAYTIWGLGTFSNTTNDQMPVFLAASLLPAAVALFCIKPLNAFLLGDNYATNLGYNVKAIRNIILIVSSLLSAVVTAFCGPISFLGLAVPHLARLTLKTDNHAVLLPSTMLIGGNVALLCFLITIFPGSSSVLPINAITPLIGAPIILKIILKK
ncbi:MAG: iron ABC transporter permease [Bacteroidaceae bacterium]|nr:iron ABC transporter permease [Bacteroidaceae bacterium]